MTAVRPPAWLIPAIYPFAAGAVAVNVFFAGLIGTWLGWPALSPGWSVAIGAVFGWPLSRVFARHLARLAADVDGR